MPYLLTGRQKTNLLGKEVDINQIIHMAETGQCYVVFHSYTHVST